jgi:hypothetical protein
MEAQALNIFLKFEVYLPSDFLKFEPFVEIMNNFLVNNFENTFKN